MRRELKRMAPLWPAIKRSDTALAIALINKGKNVNEKSSEGTLLHIAVGQNLKEIVELRIAKGADVNAKAFQIPSFGLVSVNEKHITWILSAW